MNILRSSDSCNLYEFYSTPNNMWNSFNPRIHRTTYQFCKHVIGIYNSYQFTLGDTNPHKKHVITNTLIPQDTTNKFISNNIKKYIETTLFDTITYMGCVNKITWKLTIYYNEKLSASFIQSLIYRIEFLLKLYIPTKNIIFTPINIMICMSDFKKKIYYSDYSKKQPELGIDNINSACCTKYINKFGNISIWRKEEVEKVLVHELIHALHYDFVIYDKTIDTQISNKFDINNIKNVNIFEAYTEALATVLSHIIYLQLSNKVIKKHLRKLLTNEAKHSIFQIAKILKYYGYTEFSNCNFYCSGGHVNGSKQFKQGTSILAYYIFKGALLYNLDEFIDYLTFNNGSISPYIFKQHDGNVTELYNIILKSIDCPSFIMTVDDCIKFLISTELSWFLSSNLRMTCNEFYYLK